MLPYLMALMLGVSSAGTNEHLPSATVSFAVTIVEYVAGNIDSEQLLPGIFRVTTEYKTAYAKNEQDYLVVDRFGVLDAKPLLVMFGTPNELKVPNELVIAMAWPNLTNKQIVAAFKKSYNNGIILAMKHVR